MPSKRTIFPVNSLQNGKYQQPWLLNEALNAIHSMVLQGYLGLLRFYVVGIHTQVRACAHTHTPKIEKLRNIYAYICNYSL